jgi:hypothetical protein
MTRKNGTTKEQIAQIMSTQVYQMGDEFTASDMLDRLNRLDGPAQRITTKQRISQLLIEMQSQGLVDRVVQNHVVRFRKPGSKMLRQRWISEVAEDLCARDYPREIAGQSARDVSKRARALQAASQEACGNSV